MVKWNNELIDLLLECMMSEKNKGNFTSAGFKKASWTTITESFNTDRTPKFTVDVLQNKADGLKADWTVWKELKNQSGFGFDIETGLVTANDAVWAAYITSHPKAAKFRKLVLRGVIEMEKLWEGKAATGFLAVASTELPVLSKRRYSFESDASNSSAEGSNDESSEQATHATPVKKQSKKEKIIETRWNELITAVKSPEVVLESDVSKCMRIIRDNALTTDKKTTAVLTLKFATTKEFCTGFLVLFDMKEKVKSKFTTANTFCDLYCFRFTNTSSFVMTSI